MADLQEQLNQTDGVCTELTQLVAKLSKQRDQLVDALISALPFVEDAKDSDVFKPHYVAGRITTIRSALDAVGAL